MFQRRVENIEIESCEGSVEVGYVSAKLFAAYDQCWFGPANVYAIKAFVVLA